MTERPRTSPITREQLFAEYCQVLGDLDAIERDLDVVAHQWCNRPTVIDAYRRLQLARSRALTQLNSVEPHNGARVH